ncbi:PREDICTED: olfactory receptor 11A1-like [Cyprinodon variegatus]|uniref:olfactory receptor 11A1-like n=1 Tax=Cyprinodon variegatus TaxID=28743 RepID=UPI000742B911|nr:PREDICTED: olfactory receptor 11A1-like [Cyprinodon variegatus]
MRINSTQVLYFTLSAYIDTGSLKYLSFFIVLCLYVLIIGSNVLLIVVICLNRSLHEPMYMFLCSLFVNELFGSTSLFPFMLIQILSDVHIISAPLCFLQIFCMYTYGSVEFGNLAVMSYDRYVAICRPLQYNSLMTSQRIVFLVSVTWIYSFITVGVTILMSSSLQFCENVLNKIYCTNHSVIKLACNEPRVNNIYELVMLILAAFAPISIILYTYMRILKVCFSGSKETRQKAVSTCTPHLASVINFSFGVSFEILESRFNMNNVPGMLRIFLALYYLNCQPFLNPLLYGLNMSKIRNLCKKLVPKFIS